MKMLKVGTPPLTYMPWNASNLAIAMAEPDIKTWLYCHYINFHIKYWTETCPKVPYIEFQDIPDWVEEKIIPIELLIRKFQCITDFIVYALDKERYVYFPIDMYYLKNYTHHYLRTHDHHQILIYGYEDNIFHIGDFFGDGYYHFQTCTTEEIKESIISILYHADEWGYWFKDLYLCRNIEKNIEFDLPLLHNDLQNYLNSKNRFGNMNHQEYVGFGICVFDHIFQYLDELSHIENNIDIRILNALVVHKQLMVEKVNHLISEKFIYDAEELLIGFRKEYNLCVINQNLAMKYNLGSKSDIISKIIDNLKLVYDLDKENVAKLLHKIETESDI